ncbi:MAG TPA: Hsp20/alpha crystallin family protein [bacterium]|nr:Hsp20/alpha crystallin family protein [bacterium]
MSFFKAKSVKLFTDYQPDLNQLARLAESQNSAGRLAIDVYKTDGALVVRSTIAGATIDDLEIIIDNQLLIIKGQRSEPEVADYLDYLHRECYWGAFSRTISLPLAVNEDAVEADLDNGVLTIILPIKDSQVY